MEIRESGDRRIFVHPFNQRVYAAEHRCTGCREWIAEEEVVWCLLDGTRPYCVNCAPEGGEERG